MSRFSSDYYEEEFNNQSDLWWANVQRALSGRRGQAALAELEEALLALPEPRLIEGRLATAEGAVCAVGAYALHKAVAAGEDRAAVLAELARVIPGMCGTCWHGEHRHTAGGCAECVARNTRLEAWNAHNAEVGTGTHHALYDVCAAYVDGGHTDEPESADATACVGRNAGMTYVLAWHLGNLNDEQYGGLTAEERYVRVLAWVRRAQGKPSLVPS